MGIKIVTSLNEVLIFKEELCSSLGIELSLLHCFKLNKHKKDNAVCKIRIVFLRFYRLYSTSSASLYCLQCITPFMEFVHHLCLCILGTLWWSINYLAGMRPSPRWETIGSICYLFKGTCKQFNPLRSKFLRGNIRIYLHFMSFLLINKTQVVEFLPQVR